jgi:hypothetical protein
MMKIILENEDYGIENEGILSEEDLILKNTELK